MVFILVSLNLISCATSNNPSDPYESFNRKTYAFNSGFDKYILRPTAVGYNDYVPDPVRNSIQNFYNNLRDYVTFGDDVLQLKGVSAMHTFMRVAVNSTFGIFGLIDIASNLGLPDEKNTFGNTLKFYGWENSNYLVIPIFGPSTVRDGIGLIPDTYFNPTWYFVDDIWISIGLFGLNAVNERTKYLSQDEILEQSLDPYIMMRDLYLQYSGNNSQTDIEIDDLISQESNTKVPSSLSDEVDQYLDNQKLPAKSTNTIKTNSAYSNQVIDEIYNESTDTNYNNPIKTFKKTPQDNIINK